MNSLAFGRQNQENKEKITNANRTNVEAAHTKNTNFQSHCSMILCTSAPRELISHFQRKMIAANLIVAAIIALTAVILMPVGSADTTDEVQCDPFPFGTNIVNVVFATIVGKLFPNSCLCKAPCRSQGVDNFVYFYYTASGESYFYRMDKNDTVKNKMLFEEFESIKFLVHGYTDRVQFNKSGWMEPTGFALANSSNSIVVLVDYGNISSCNYERTVEEIVPAVGVYLAEFIKKYELDPNSIELIGHSLGAHVAGYTGASLNGTIYRITGLDAAGPGFIDKGLNKSCAQFVQVLHTNGGDLGSSRILGDIDFFANNKSAFQPGCPFKQCGHAKAIFYYYASLLPQYEFIGFDCNQQHSKQTAPYSRFGIYNDGDGLGEFCFNTTACFPYMIPLIDATTVSMESTSMASSTMVRSTLVDAIENASAATDVDTDATSTSTASLAAATATEEQKPSRQTKKHKYHKVERPKLSKLCICKQSYDSACNDDCFRYDNNLD